MIISSFLSEHDIAYEKESNNDIDSYFLGLNLDSCFCKGVIGVNRGIGEILILLIIPVRFGEENYPEIKELISRINYYDEVGGFALDQEDGEIGYRRVFSFDQSGEDFLQGLSWHFAESITMMNTYLAPILKTAFGDKSPSVILNNADPKLYPYPN